MAGVHVREPGDSGQHLLADGCVRRGRLQVPERDVAGKVDHPEVDGDEHERPQAVVEVFVAGRQLLERPARKRDARLRVGGEEQGAAEELRRVRALQRIGEPVVAGLQVLRRRRSVDDPLGHPELDQQLRAALRRGRLRERALEVRNRALAGALASGIARGVLEQVADPRLGARRHHQQMGGDALGRCGQVGQDPGGAGMAELALREW
jgi:hypothetical protein